jgi:hypothetical protein
MGKAIPEQHPAVVLRSHYVHLRALLVAALIAVLGLTAAVVIVANDDDVAVTTNTPTPAMEAGGGAPQIAPLPQRRLDGAVDTAPAPRYDGGPNEGGADIAPSTNAPARPSQAQAFPGQSQQAQQAEAGASRHDIRMDLRRLRAGGGPNQGSADVTMSPPVGASSVLSQTGPYRYDGGPNEGSADVTTGHLRGSAPVMPQSDGFRYGGSN